DPAVDPDPSRRDHPVAHARPARPTPASSTRIRRGHDTIHELGAQLWMDRRFRSSLRRRKPTIIANPPADRSSEDGSGTDFVVPKARLSISSPPVPGTPITLSTLTRPIRSVVDTTPKKFAPTFPKIIDVPNKSLLGLNSEIAIFPATGPGNASKPTADTA